MRLDRTQILRIMPHRNPMLLVDVIELGKGGSFAIAYKNITFSEPCYRSADGAQSDDDLAYPLSLLVESFGQAAGLLLSKKGFLDAGNSTRTVVFGEFSAIEIFGNAYPGDRLRHELHLDYAGSQLAIFRGRTQVGKRIILTFGGLKAFLVDTSTLRRQAGDA